MSRRQQWKHGINIIDGLVSLMEYLSLNHTMHDCISTVVHSKSGTVEVTDRIQKIAMYVQEEKYITHISSFITASFTHSHNMIMSVVNCVFLCHWFTFAG